MDIILLGITVVALGVALVMSLAAWRLTRDEKKRSAARVAALSLAASAPETRESGQGLSTFAAENHAEKPLAKAPWSAPRIVSASARSDSGELRRDLAEAVYGREGGPAPVVSTAVAPAVELSLNQPVRIEPARASEPRLRDSYGGQVVAHASGFLGAEEVQRDSGGRQKSLAFAAVLLFVVLSGGLAWMMSGPRGTTAVAVGSNSPLELVSLTHARQNQKLAVSGLVRNPAAGKPIEHLSAVVFLFDRMGTFVTSSRANVDFLKLGAGDESPFVVSLDAPATVARYRVSFRTDDGIVPHIDRRGAPVAPAETVGIQQSTVKSSVGSQQ